MKAVKLALTAAALLLTGLSTAQEESAVPPRSMDQVVEVLSTISETVQQAYEELLVDSPMASGELELSFQITPDGFVDSVLVTGPDELLPVIGVIEESLWGLDFGPCSTQVENLPVSAPLVLTPPAAPPQEE